MANCTPQIKRGIRSKKSQSMGVDIVNGTSIPYWHVPRYTARVLSCLCNFDKDLKKPRLQYYNRHLYSLKFERIQTNKITKKQK